MNPLLTTAFSYVSGIIPFFLFELERRLPGEMDKPDRYSGCGLSKALQSQ